MIEIRTKGGKVLLRVPGELRKITKDEIPHVSAILIDADLNGANLEDADLSFANLQGSNLTRAIMTTACFENAILEDANLSGSTAEGAHFSDAILRNTNLSNGDFYWAYFFRANLKGANLRGASLRGANAESACFDDADLSNCDMGFDNLGGKTYLSDASFQWAKLFGANLEGVDDTRTNFSDAFYDSTTRFRKGFDPTAHGMVFTKP